MSINIDRPLNITQQSNITDPATEKDKQAAGEIILTAKNPFHGKTLKFFSHVPLSQHPNVVENYAKQAGMQTHLTQFIDSLARRFNEHHHSEELMLAQTTPLKNRNIKVS